MKIEYFLPENIITNEDLKLDFPHWDADKTVSKIGIKERHVSAEGQTALDLGEMAAKKVLASENKEEIDFLLFCTQSPDYFLPTSACILQERLGLSQNIGALDYNLGCSGYVYGLALAKGILSASIADNVLLVVADTYLKHIHAKDVANKSIFGDGASATILSKDDLVNMSKFVLGTDGKGKDNLITRNGAFRNSFKSEAEEISYGNGNIYTENNLYMNGPEIFNFTIEKVPVVVASVLEKNGFTIDDIDLFVFHQANRYMLNYLRRKIRIPKEKFCIDMEHTGNTVSSTIPIALKNAIDQEKLVKGNRVMLVGFGVGYSWGATIIKI